MSDGTDNIATDVTRIKVLVADALAVGNLQQYAHHKAHADILELMNLALIDLDDRIKALEP